MVSVTSPWYRIRFAVERANLSFQIEELMTSPATITQLLVKWRNGDKAAHDEALRRLEAIGPQKSRFVESRYFGVLF